MSEKPAAASPQARPPAAEPRPAETRTAGERPAVPVPAQAVPPADREPAAHTRAADEAHAGVRPPDAGRAGDGVPPGAGQAAVPPPPLAPGVRAPLPLPQQYAPPPEPAARRRARPLIVLGVAAVVVVAATAVTFAFALMPRSQPRTARLPDLGTSAKPLPEGGTAGYADGVRVTVGQARVADSAVGTSDAGASVEFTVTVVNGSSHKVRLADADVSAFTEGDDAGPAYDRLSGTLAPGAVRSARFTVVVPDQETLEVDVAPDHAYRSAVWRLDVPS